MKLPQIEAAFVPREKITDYLLSPTHLRGRDKSTFFRRFGFQQEKWGELAVALHRHAIDNELAMAQDTAFGTRYTVEGVLETPSGGHPVIRSVWTCRERENGSQIGNRIPCLKEIK